MPHDQVTYVQLLLSDPHLGDTETCHDLVEAEKGAFLLRHLSQTLSSAKNSVKQASV